MKCSVLGLLLVLFPVLCQAADPYPLRTKFPGVVPISTESLSAQYEATHIVDVRAGIEYDVIHVAKAVHIPVASAGFLSELEKLRPKQDGKPIAFYCNGITCAKSYEAAEMAVQAGFSNVYCYDDGMPAWVERYPERTTLMGETPARKEKLISDALLDRHLIPYAEFARRAGQANAMVIDVRDPFQRVQDPNLPQHRLLALSGVREIPQDRLVPLLKERKFQDKQLLITDAVGKQIRWLQYYLEEHGYKDYFFLKKGVLAAAEAGGVR